MRSRNRFLILQEEEMALVNSFSVLLFYMYYIM